MRVKKEYKKKPNVLIFENKPAFPFNYQATLDLERVIIIHLHNAKAQTNYQVHQALLNTKTKCEYTKVRRTLEDLFVLGWIDLMKNNPELYEKAIALEDNCPNKNTQLSSKPLRRFREFKGQSKLEEFKATCEVSGGCFL